MLLLTRDPVDGFVWDMKRRAFIQMMGGLAVTAGTSSVFGAEQETGTPFSMKFAPHPRQLPTAPKDYLGQLQFATTSGSGPGKTMV